MKREKNWWNKKGKDAAVAVQSVIEALIDQNHERNNDILRFARMYDEVAYEDFLSYTKSTYQPPRKLNSGRLTYNLVHSIVDELNSKIGTKKPLPEYSTDGADYSLKRKAKKRTQFAQALVQSLEVHKKAKRVFVDACITGTGIFKVHVFHGDIKVERVRAEEILIDERECIHGDPRQLHQVKMVAYDVLKDEFPGKNIEYKDEDMVRVVESWHLPSSTNAKNGRHIITTDNELLFEEEYTRDHFPFAFFHWSPLQTGFWAKGLVECLEGIQLEVQQTLMNIQKLIRASFPIIINNGASKITKEHIAKMVGNIPIINAPQGSSLNIITPNMIPEQVINHLDRLIQRAYELSGLAEIDKAAPRKEIRSAVHAEWEDDLETARFLSVAQDWQDFIAVQIPRLLMEAAHEKAMEDKSYSVAFKHSRGVNIVKLTETDLPEEMCILHPFPVSDLPSTPVGKYSRVERFLNAQLIDRDQALQLLDFPDVQAFSDDANAEIQKFEWIIEQIVDEGKFQAPQPFDNLEMGITKMQMAYDRYRMMNLEEERLDLLRTWITTAGNMLAKQQQQAALAQQQQLPPEQSPQPI